MGNALFGQYARGVNLAGAEFGENVFPGVVGTNFTYNSEATFRYFAGTGLWLIRLPLRWERLQPVLSGPLDPLNLSLLKQDLDWARMYGARVILDIQNFARYKMREEQLQEYIIDNRYNGVIKVSRADLADLWVRLSNEFKSDLAVYAYDIMNEPHDMGSADWKTISQTVLTAIRNNGDNKLIMVPGDNWSAAQTWASVHGPTGWIADPANNFRYEAHLYFDHDNSGSYKLSYEQEGAAPDTGQARLAPFVDWCRQNGVRGYLGEYGVPDNDPRWLTVLDNLLLDLDAAGFDGTYWAAGEWWGSYPLSVQPQPNSARPQAAVLAAHLGEPTPFTTISAAGVLLPAVAPDSLATGFGSGLAAADSVDLVDSAGAAHPAPILFTSASQINYLVPAAIALGQVDVTARSGGAVVGRGKFEVRNTAPALFSASGNGKGIAAATIRRVRIDGTESSVRAADGPIDFGDPSDRLFVMFYGTGLRRLASSSLQVGGIELPILSAGAQPDGAGLDQVSAELPRSLAGTGVVNVIFTADGQTANPVTLNFQRR